MTSKKDIEDFIGKKCIAVVGVSGSGKKFGAAVYRDLKQKGWRAFGVNPRGGSIEGDPLYETLDKIPQTPDAAVFVVPPKVTEEMVQEAHKLGIKNIWLQPGAESAAAVEFCQSKGLNVIYGECILMHAAPVGSIHKVHRFLHKLFGKLPQ